MQINDIQFIGSFKNWKQCPPSQYPEYAFIGRSNVGKSSLINLLTRRKDVARVSSNPGKTQSINYFLVDDAWYLVDLPGYGYAKVSKKERESWSAMIRDFLRYRESLVCTFVLIDSRLDAQEIDINFVNWLGKYGIPFVLIYTKIDKVKASQREAQLNNIRKAFLAHWEELPEQFECSSITGEGRDELLNFIHRINENIEGNGQ